MNFFGIFVIVLLNILLCRLFALGLIMLLIYIKGRSFRFSQEKWNDYFMTVPLRRLRRIFIFVYLLSAALAAALSYGSFCFFGYERPLLLALALFGLGCLITVYKYFRSKDALIEKFQKLQERIAYDEETDNL